MPVQSINYLFNEFTCNESLHFPRIKIVLSPWELMTSFIYVYVRKPTHRVRNVTLTPKPTSFQSTYTSLFN